MAGVLPDSAPAEETIGQRDLTHWRSTPGRGVSRLLARLAAAMAERIHRPVEHVALWLTALIGVGFAVASTAVAAQVYDAVAEKDGVAAFDLPVLKEAIAWRTPTRDADITTFTDLGGSRVMPVIAIVLVVGMVLAWRSRTPIVLMAIAAAGGLAMTAVGKYAIGRARPDHSLAVPPYENSPSFPSGHTVMSTVIIGIAVYLVLTHLRSALMRMTAVVVGGLFVLAMGLSRVFLGHHWLTDVMAGWALGLAWVATVVTAHRVFLTLRRDRR